MYTKILVPLDGSETSESSLPHVKAIALGCGVPDVILLMIVEPVFNQEAGTTDMVGRDLMAKVEEENKEKNRVYLNRLVGGFTAEGIHTSAALGYGKPADEIIDFAEKHNVDLIVMCTHGRSGITRWVLGSVAEKVVRHSPVPVLTVSPAGRKNAARKRK